MISNLKNQIFLTDFDKPPRRKTKSSSHKFGIIFLDKQHQSNKKK